MHIEKPRVSELLATLRTTPSGTPAHTEALALLAKFYPLMFTAYQTSTNENPR